MNVTAIAQGGLQNALARFERSAQRTIQMNNPDAGVDIAAEMVQQLNAKHEVSANISVLRTADEMMGRLLDIKV